MTNPEEKGRARLETTCQGARARLVPLSIATVPNVSKQLRYIKVHTLTDSLGGVRLRSQIRQCAYLLTRIYRPFSPRIECTDSWNIQHAVFCTTISTHRRRTFSQRAVTPIRSMESSTCSEHPHHTSIRSPSKTHTQPLLHSHPLNCFPPRSVRHNAREPPSEPWWCSHWID